MCSNPDLFRVGLNSSVFLSNRKNLLVLCCIEHASTSERSAVLECATLCNCCIGLGVQAESKHFFCYAIVHIGSEYRTKCLMNM